MWAGCPVRSGWWWPLWPKTSANLYLRGLRTDRTSTTDAATRLLHFPPGPDSTLTIHADAAYYSTQYSGCLGLKQTLDSASTSTLTADLDYPRYQSAGDNHIANVFLAG